MPKKRTVEINRFARQWFGCPFCQAKPGERCINTDTTLRDRTHNERYTIANKAILYQARLRRQTT